MEHRDLAVARAIYSGSLDTAKKHIIDQGGNFPLAVTEMIREDYKKIYNMDILALVIAGEASQPDR